MTALETGIASPLPGAAAAYDVTVLLPFGADPQQDVAALDALGTLDIGLTWNLLAADLGGVPAVTDVLRSADGDLELVEVPGSGETEALATVLPRASGRLLWLPPAGAAPTARLLTAALDARSAAGAVVLVSSEYGLLADTEIIRALQLPGAQFHPSRRSFCEALAAQAASAGHQVSLPGVGAHPDGLTPLLLSLINGRCGSTLTMQLLGTSEAISFDRQPPYENNYLGYLTRLAGHIALPAGMTVGDGGALSRGEVEFAAALPFDTSVDRPELSRRMLRGMWREFSDFRRATEPGARLWAEKYGRQAIPEVLPPARVLMLVRDPRDMWCSIDAFDRRRGFYGFGRAADESRQTFLQRHLDSVQEYAKRRCPANSSVLIVRYEDMVQDLTAQARRIGAWLGVQLSADAVQAQSAAFRDHMTSTDPAASVARWRTELPAADAALFSDQLLGELLSFGYPLD